uniref:Reverse transcriptase zinc-binding domain-containing protein n=2 Tax=Oryza sativa subsp. japonica TaxID=39947 RepID=Q53MT9_ORYSJ|nr:hypothetical protein LOC_Os11g18330 [Oryza sativa Japonica Group]ABA92764.1 hypothetical protein LOC_Os11g18330 [Oryza sativa Japonica Group]
MGALPWSDWVKKGLENLGVVSTMICCYREKTFIHLFFQCPFSSQCWAQFGIVWDVSLAFE